MAMRFQIPQFIDIQDKIFGPLTFRQFIFVAGGGGLAYIALRFIPSIFKYPVAVALAGFGAAMAFYKMNGRTFPQILQAFLTYMVTTKIYVWRQRPLVQTAPKKKAIPVPQSAAPLTTVSNQKLRNLAWNLDILDAHNKKVQ
jgi:hypothetical protein